ncbi:helix-turn-helix domain-containing protein [Streptomyces olivaceus]
MLLTTGQAAEELGCAITTLRRLAQAQLLPGLARRGVRTMIPHPVVTALKERPLAALHHQPAPEIAVLRVDVARSADDPDRDWIGYSAALPADDLLKALRGWWRCDAASVAAGGILPVTLSGYVVALLTGLEHWENNGQGRHAFTQARLAGYVTDLAAPTAVYPHPATETDRAIARPLLGKRLPSHSGGAIAYLRTHAAH